MTDISGPQAQYEAFLAEGRFMIQRSRSTGAHVFYPKVSGPSGEADLEWVAASGRGTVYAITVIRSRAGSKNVALIELEEGARMMSSLPNAETVAIGTPVAARIEAWEEGHRIVFDPVTEEGT